MSDRPLVYQTSAFDAVTQLPVYIIDSTALGDALPDPDGELRAYLSVFPETEFVLVFFASGAPKVPQVNWLRKAHSSLNRGLKKRIRKVYVVHASWYTKALNKALAPIVSPKFARKIYYMKSIADLSREVDITVLDISPTVYYHDFKRTDSSCIPVPKHYISIFGGPLPENEPTSYWRAALTFLSSVRLTNECFEPLSRSSEHEVALVDILLAAVKRQQKLRLYDYGPFVVLAVLKEYMVSLSTPLVDIESVPLPLKFSSSYAKNVVSECQPNQMRHLTDLVTFCREASRYVDVGKIAKSLGPAVMGLRNPDYEDYVVSVRFFKILVECWATDVPSAPTIAPTIASSASSISSEGSFIDTEMVRRMPTEVDVNRMRVIRPQSRKAFGKVAEIIKIYDETQY